MELPYWSKGLCVSNAVENNGSNEARSTGPNVTGQTGL